MRVGFYIPRGFGAPREWGWGYSYELRVIHLQTQFDTNIQECTLRYTLAYINMQKDALVYTEYKHTNP